VPRLINGQQFPSFSVPAVGGGTISLPDDLVGSYGIVLVYRGSWCPYCNAQLASFSRASEALAEVGAKVVALSVDDETTAAALVDKHRLSFPIGHSADADKVSDLTGAYLNDDPHYLQSTGFVLAPDGAVLTAVYSSAAIGRLVVDDVLGFIRYTRDHEA
jgi:peroxiredoxin